MPYSGLSEDTELFPQGLPDDQLLEMRPAPDADHEAWRAYHQLLSEAGKLNPSK